MSINREQLEEEIIRDEGIVDRIYLDHFGNKTFGIGHQVTKNDPEYSLSVGTHVSRERIEEAFQKDLYTAILDCIHLYTPQIFNSWPREVKHVMINMMFNLGRTRMSKFRRMNHHLKAREWKLAAAEGRNSLWYTQVSNRAERLMKRLEAV